MIHTYKAELNNQDTKDYTSEDEHEPSSKKDSSSKDVKSNELVVSKSMLVKLIDSYLGNFEKTSINHLLSDESSDY